MTDEDLYHVTGFASIEMLDILLQWGKEAGIIQPNNLFNRALSNGFMQRNDCFLGIQLLTRYGLIIDELSARIFRSKNKEHIERLLSLGILPNEQLICEIVALGRTDLSKLILVLPGYSRT